jgi:serine/threonine protein kinase
MERDHRPCLSDDDIIAFVEHRLPPSGMDRVHRHVDLCEVCQQLIVETAQLCAGSAQGSASILRSTVRDSRERTIRCHERPGDGALQPFAFQPDSNHRPAWLPALDGCKIDRYFVVGAAGTGGMGLVLKAHDPQLDRTVAIKLVRPDRSKSDDHARLLREARAMAKVSHSNVVHVYDAGTHEGTVFVAMEYIDGQTLRQWLEERPRLWTEILAKLIDAGRGIAAAHRAGLVHRDIKPTNLLIDRDGRVRMTDFGLARPTVSPDDPEAANLSGESDSRDAPSEVTELSRFAGTPAYMAPERLTGHADARSDQFSLCVMLYLALFGRHPFAGSSRDEVWARMAKNDVTPPPKGSPVPLGVQEMIIRGLNSEPAARFPTMDELLDGLTEASRTSGIQQVGSNPKRGRGRVARIAIATAAVFVLGAWFLMATAAHRFSGKETASNASVDSVAMTPATCDEGEPISPILVEQTALSSTREPQGSFGTTQAPRARVRRTSHHESPKRRLYEARVDESALDSVGRVGTEQKPSNGEGHDGLRPLSHHRARVP